MRRTLRSRLRGLCAWPLFAGAAIALAPAGCGGGEEPSATAPAKTAGASDATLIELRDLGLAYLELDRHDDAARTFDELITFVPDEPMAHANRGLVELRAGRVAAAGPRLDEAGRLAPTDPDVALVRAHGAVLAGDDGAARKILESAIAVNPEGLRVRWLLVEVLRRTNDATAAASALEEIVANAPGNLVARLARARALLESGDLAAATSEIAAIDPLTGPRDAQAQQLFAEADAACRAGNANTARSAIVGLDNVLKPSRAWQGALDALRGPPVPVAPAVERFVARAVVAPPAPAPVTLAFRDASATAGLAGLRLAHAVPLVGGKARGAFAAIDGGNLAVFARGEDGVYRVSEQAPAGREAGGTSRLVVTDYNNDRLLDVLIGLADGTLLAAIREAQGGFVVAPVDALAAAGGESRFRVLLQWDAEHDGDLDYLAGRDGVPVALLRNNGDGTFIDVAQDLGFETVGADLGDAVTADFDDDGDVDLLVATSAGKLVGFDNLRSGSFRRVVPDSGRDTSGDAPAWRPPAFEGVRSLVAADFDDDGWIDLAAITASGAGSACRVARNLDGAAFEIGPAVALPGGTAAPGASGASTSFREADLDNDGDLDLLAVTDGALHVLRNSAGMMTLVVPTPVSITGEVIDARAFDSDLDGDLDLLVTGAGGTVSLWENTTEGAGHWIAVELEAILEGSQRNNSYGIGGTVEVKAAGRYQKRIVRDAITRAGLGASERADVVRVVWPNGVPQDLIRPAANQIIVEKQQLKGSCPFLFAHDGEAMRFVTDVLWRSPVGMKINAQTVAAVTSTEDWVRVTADQLRERGGGYDLDITAALWETIFIDSVELWAIDHSPSVEIFVDERFVAPVLPPFEIHVVEALREPRAAVDHRGRDVLDAVARRDGVHLGGFEKGRYQGVAETHYVEVDAGSWDEPAHVKLIASGWIMPTDTSLNVAISQGAHDPPQPLRVLVADGRGGWTEAIANAGFPAGKFKTIVLDLTGAFESDDHRVRIETNLEIYWDRIAFDVREPGAARSAVPVPQVLARTRAQLDFVGFPEMARKSPTSPEVPDYSQPAQHARWRDLEGWYTRYGDVEELLAGIDDRMVIMNAGDRIRLRFATGEPPAPGLVRDFIFYSDGWEKDGDLNTVASKTVAPLPFHGMREYPYPEEALPPALRPDHPDWARYHTRWVTPAPFRDLLRKRGQPPFSAE